MSHTIKPLILDFILLITQKETNSAFSYHNKAISIFKHSLNIVKNDKGFDNNFSEIIYQCIECSETSEEALNEFIKALRQMDLTHSGDMDMIIYNLVKMEEVNYLMKNIFKFTFNIIKENKFLRNESELEINYLKRLIEEYTFSYI